MGKVIKTMALHIALLIGLVYAGYNPLYAQGVSISPSRIFLTGSPGETVEQTLTFTNSSDKEYNFDTRIEDWVRDTLGAKVFSPKGTLETSNGDWISLPSQVISVGPKETKEIVVVMEIPEDASETTMTNSMLFFTQLVPQDDDFVPDDANMGVRVLFEFGVHAYYTPPGNSNLDIEYKAIEDLGLITNGEKQMRQIGVKVKNIGNVNNDAKINLELTNTVTGEELDVQPTQISLMPGAEQWAFFYLDPEIKGSYLGVALISLGATTNTRVAEKQFDF